MVAGHLTKKTAIAWWVETRQFLQPLDQSARFEIHLILLSEGQ